MGNGSVTSSENSVSVGSEGNERRIQHVADGQDYYDAVNYGQFSSVVNRNYYKLDTKINKVGAGAAALASLRPLDYDPNDKWSGAIGFGSLHGESAFAMGAFYRPSNDIVYSLGANVGGDDNMVNASINFSFGHREKKQVETIKQQSLPEMVDNGDLEFRLQQQSEKIVQLSWENVENKRENAELKTRIKRLERVVIMLEKELKKEKSVE